MGSDFQILRCGDGGRRALAVHKPERRGLAVFGKTGCPGWYEGTGFRGSLPHPVRSDVAEVRASVLRVINGQRVLPVTDEPSVFGQDVPRNHIGGGVGGW